jgi:hypothetical protein
VGFFQVIDLGPFQPGTLRSVQFTGVVNFGPELVQYQLCLQ